MNKLERISQIFESATQITFNDSSSFVIMSDCHRGAGSLADNFSKNQNIFIAALNHYYQNNYTYIELGDGDELWENNKIIDILNAHKDAFSLLSKFYNKGRLYMLFGNHDMEKKNYGHSVNNFRKYFDTNDEDYLSLFEKINIREGLILRHSKTDDKILLIHGHQVDTFNYDFWKLGKFLVKHFWKPLESFGINDPTSTSKNYEKRISVANMLSDWTLLNKHVLIAGHTHKPIFPETDQVPYFNDGSCVHPRYITAIEIAEGNICLVKWSVKVNENGLLFIDRDIMAGPNKLNDYFLSLKGYLPTKTV